MTGLLADKLYRLESSIVMITGLPGTGKPTLAMALSRELGGLHLNTDRVRKEMGLMGRYDPETKKRIYDEILKRAGEALISGETVIIDGTFYREALRQPFVDLALRHDRPIRWIELRAEEETIRRRVGRPREYSEADFEV